MEEVRIYIAEQRGEMPVGEGCVKSTLNNGKYVSPYRMPIGCLHHLNEWIGHAGQVFRLLLAENSVTVFIPLTGEIVVRIEEIEYAVPLGTLLVLPTNTNILIQVGQLEAGEDCYVFQQIVFSTTAYYSKQIQRYTLPIVHTPNTNKLLPILEEDGVPFQLYMGAFVGNVDYTLYLGQRFRDSFAITLEGNFEVERRLLFPQDGLFLPKYQKMETECLSATGILLVLHF